jgi:hypothetical protein
MRPLCLAHLGAKRFRRRPLIPKEPRSTETLSADVQSGEIDRHVGRGVQIGRIPGIIGPDARPTVLTQTFGNIGVDQIEPVAVEIDDRIRADGPNGVPKNLISSAKAAGRLIENGVAGDWVRLAVLRMVAPVIAGDAPFITNVVIYTIGEVEIVSGLG